MKWRAQPIINIGKMAHTLAHGALMGARGNSGVILSQLWRGFAEDLTAVPIALAGHLPHEERPAEVNAALEAFDFMGRHLISK